MAPNRFTCEQVFARLDDFVDHELSGDEMRLVQEHLETCAACASEHRFEATVIDEVRQRLRRIAVPPSLLSRIAERLGRISPDAS